MPRGRPRKPENAKLPDYVYLTKRGYVWKEYADGAYVREVLIAPRKASLGEVWEAFEALTSGPKNTLRWLTGRYLESEQHRAKADKTRHEYERNAEAVLSAPVSGGFFGDVPLKKITPGVIRKYLDKRSEKAGPVLANREVGFMSAVFSWGYERDLCGINPCKGVRRNTEKARTRYVTDAEYKAVYDQAPDHVKAAMEMAYLCRLRKVEVLSLTRRAIKDTGLEVHRTKGSKSSLVYWSPRLRAAVDLALATNTKPVTQSAHIIRGKDGGRVRPSSFDTAWQRLMAKVGVERFTFHDLKAKGVSDTAGDKQAASGHKTRAMVERYDRKLAEVGPTR